MALRSVPVRRRSARPSQRPPVGAGRPRTHRPWRQARPLDWILGQTGLGRQDVLAFGDGENDLALLRAAGYGAATANARLPLRDIADEIVPGNDEDGVAQCLEARFF
ncbi:HAD hydrolase family protein [Streptomyces sp. B-S-A8]|uniref:HAD hydrolase family protein n=1 Tax=Streptomyces solicavernae TaxID=3043614 RepID=A0ABT6RY51_9ACTN|nr:HAD hydrolase family protein [Streptomyces sp. B-S-A8]MDI3389332.1 HAD hydrolase family protein [Streptomyces sp. B-S-A8]